MYVPIHSHLGESENII